MKTPQQIRKKRTDFVLLSFYFAMATIILLLVCLFLFIRGNNLEMKGFLKGYETASELYKPIAFLSYNEGFIDCKENTFNNDDLIALNILDKYNITYNFDNKSTLGWDNPNDLPNKFVGLENTCQEKEDIIYSSYIDTSNASLCFKLEKNEVVFCDKQPEVRSCKHNNVATIYIKNGYTNIYLDVDDSMKYLRNNKTNEIYKVKEGIVNLSFVKSYEDILLVNVSQETSDILDKYYPSYEVNKRYIE